MTTSDIRNIQVGLLAAAALAFAFGLQYLFGFAPCHLCLLERWPYLAVIVLAVAGRLLRRPRPMLALAAIALLGNALLSGFHVGVEQGVFDLPGSCVAGGAADTIEQLRQQMLEARPTCDQVSAQFLGLSLAAWNGLYALALAALALSGAIARPRAARG